MWRQLLAYAILIFFAGVGVAHALLPDRLMKPWHRGGELLTESNRFGIHLVGLVTAAGALDVLYSISEAPRFGGGRSWNGSQKGPEGRRILQDVEDDVKNAQRKSVQAPKFVAGRCAWHDGTTWGRSGPAEPSDSNS